jgi:hypothetical protein
MARKIRTVKGVARKAAALHRRTAKLYKRPYVLKPALQRHLEQFNDLKAISDPAERYQAFRRIPSLEYEMLIDDAALAPKRRQTMAQQARARGPRLRVTSGGMTIRAIVFDLLKQVDDPWQKRAKEFWRPFMKSLERHGLKPVLTTVRDPAKERIEYRSGEARRFISRGQFENVVSQVRRMLAAKN